MTKINNLFFLFLLSCIEYGIGNVYWNKNYTHIISMIVAMFIGLSLLFSKHFYTKESYDFFRKQTFFTSLIFLICTFINSNRNLYKIIDESFFTAFIGAFMLWISTMRYRTNGNNRDKNERINNSNGPTLA